MIFTKLILAHILGDFLLQPDRWVADKESKKLKSKYLYWHILIHWGLTMLLLWNLDYWWIAVIIAVSHFLIDSLKLQLQKPKNKRLFFFADQILHLAIIAGIAFFIGNIDLQFLSDTRIWILLTGAVFITTPVSVIIKMLLSAWIPVTIDHSKMQTESLRNAGKYIGILERLLVYTFIVFNHWEGVGFMIAAKSVFRFSDLAEAKQRKLTEYVLVGTLLSFGAAIAVAIGVKNVI